MSLLFRLEGAKRRDRAVATWFQDPHYELRDVARVWFARMKACGDDVLEVIHDGCPTACVGEAAFGYVAAFRAHVNVGFFNGASLLDPARLLEGSGKRMRHVKLRAGAGIDEAALGALIKASYDEVRSHLAPPQT